MRKIKFRKWDEEEGVMIDGDSLAFELYAPLVDLLSQDGISQFTGVYDKDGREIYEGDIIKWTDSDGEEKLNVVEFKRGHFFICNYNYSIDSYPQVKVIGNIYENPELLQK